MKSIFTGLLLSTILCSVSADAQDMKNFKLYNPTENTAEALGKAVSKAKSTGKYVFVQIGGNWCVWCARFHDFINADKQIDSLIQSSFIVYHMNYSSENKNPEMLKKLDYPQRFGFPVFIILDGNGKKLHTQNSAYLEEGKGYNKDKVMEFFQHWSPKAFEPEQYKNF